MSFYSNNIKNEFFINNNEISNLHFQLHHDNSPLFRIRESKEIFQTQFEQQPQKKCKLIKHNKNKKILNQIKFLSERYNSFNNDEKIHEKDSESETKNILNINFFPTSLLDTKSKITSTTEKITNIKSLFMEKSKLKKSNSCFLSLNKDYSNLSSKRRVILLPKRNSEEKNKKKKIGFVAPKNIFVKFNFDKTKLPVLKLKQYEMHELINYKNKQHPFKFK